MRRASLSRERCSPGSTRLSLARGPDGVATGAGLRGGDCMTVMGAPSMLRQLRSLASWALMVSV